MSAQLENLDQLTLFAAASPAKIYQWPASAKAWLESDQGYGSRPAAARLRGTCTQHNE